MASLSSARSPRTSPPFYARSNLVTVFCILYSLFHTFRENLVGIDELIGVMRQIQNIPEDKLHRIAEAFDDNKDGKIDIDDVIKVSQTDTFI